jgi:hypothetical protein
MLLRSVGDAASLALTSADKILMTKEACMTFVDTLIAEPPPLHATDDGTVRLWN